MNGLEASLSIIVIKSAPEAGKKKENLSKFITVTYKCDL